MSNKNLIKEMFDNKFNKDKNYKETLSKIEGGSTMKKTILKLSLVPVCLVLAIVRSSSFEC